MIPHIVCVVRFCIVIKIDIDSTLFVDLDRMSQPEVRSYFEMMPDGTSKKVTYLQDNLSVIMEDGIYDLSMAKGQGHYDQIMQGIEKSLNLVLGDDETTKRHCKRVLADPKMQSCYMRFRRNQLIKNYDTFFVCMAMKSALGHCMVPIKGYLFQQNLIDSICNSNGKNT